MTRKPTPRNAPPAKPAEIVGQTLERALDPLTSVLKRAALKRDVQKRFPGYADLVAPKPAAIEEIRAVLRPDEAFLSIYLGRFGSFVWALPKQVPVAFAAVATNAGDISRKVHELRKALEPLYVRQGGFEFNPQRHDFSDKALLGQTVHGRGLAEVDQALDMLARHPATARFVARKLAQFWVGDTPREALLTRLATEFQRTDGDIAALLRSLFAAPEFQTSLGRKLKDPAHYALSAARWRCDTRPLPTGSSVVAWLGRLGQSRFGRTTPDGYPLTADAWSSSGQLNTRFELAKTWGALREQRLQCAAPTLAHATQQVLSQARSVAEWNMLRLAAPEFMYD